MPPTTKRQTIGLAMIVRNNANVIRRCLESARPHIDHWTIVDTGSDDDTPQIVQELLASIPGQLHHREWRNSGENRTELTVLAQGTADYLLLLDADHELQAEAGVWLPPLTAPLYLLRERDHGLEWRMPRLAKADRPWHYVGAAHEYIDNQADREPLDELVVIHHGDGRTVSEKLNVAREQLEQAFVADPADPRTVFYLAQTHRDLGNVDKAIALYRLRAEMVGWDEERFFARYRLGCLLTEHVSFHDGARELLGAYRMRPGRVEPLRALATAASAIADGTPMPADLLFVHPHLYKDG